MLTRQRGRPRIMTAEEFEAKIASALLRGANLTEIAGIAGVGRSTAARLLREIGAEPTAQIWRIAR
jgi:hypothetical protein